MIKLKIKKKMAEKLKLRYSRKLKMRSKPKFNGTEQKPRLSIFRSNKYLYAQIIDDEANKVIVSANTLQKDLKEAGKSNKNVEAAKKLGKTLAEKAKGKGVEKVIFDRNGFSYAGKIKAIAEEARKAGLSF
jgi:large subunit ribosomal protein L18